MVTASYLLANAVFALLYLSVGGVANAKPGSFMDAFFFSVETMGTIGYGAMYPRTMAANLCSVLESVVGLLLTAMTTGLVFAKFSRPTARIVFSEKAVICPVNGVPTFMFRIGNERGNAIVDAQLRCVLSRVERTQEGERVYRLHDLKLTRDRALTLNRALAVSHTITAQSVLAGHGPHSLVEQEYEVEALVVGLDDTAMQTVHAVHRYYPHDIVWGARLADVLFDASDGAMVLDLRQFHHIQPSEPTAGFPYPEASGGVSEPPSA
jgi:inward rectifier potassium channel